MVQTAHTGSFGPLLRSYAGLEGSLTRVTPQVPRSRHQFTQSPDLFQRVVSDQDAARLQQTCILKGICSSQLLLRNSWEIG